MIEYEWFPGPLVPEELLEECMSLYSSHYGRWSSQGPRPGEQIRLSLPRAKAWLGSDDSNLALARERGTLIGYAITIKTSVADYGMVSWVTQLVVHEEYRHANVAKTLLFSMWGFSDHFAWGLITANPYAVRALEKATRRRSTPKRIRRNRRKLKQIGVEHVPYMTPQTKLELSPEHSRINTEFFLDHSQLPEMIKRATAPEKPWLLGSLEEGWEWFAFTFHDQPQIGLTPDEIETMLTASDQITQRAYSRMALSANHAWAQHTEAEVGIAVDELDVQDGGRILDFGCGDGRHAIHLARKGFEVVGVDYVESRIKQASEVARREGLTKASFRVGDARTVRVEGTFKAAICLYDVIGTYASNGENLQILKNIRNHLEPGGRCLLSVMNLDATVARAKHKFDLSETPDALLKLPASNTMEETGNIFNPDYYLVDITSGVVYRKEQFVRGSMLPEELIVRDRRYSKETITRLCHDAGLQVLWARYVRAGAWRKEHDRLLAKEILLLCEVPTCGNTAPQDSK